jgi:hypothetical protein
MKLSHLAVTTGLALTALSANAAPNLVVNGSFEYTTSATTPGQNPGTWSVYKSIIGWTGDPNIEVRDNVAGKAQDGGNFVELDTHRTSYSSATNSSMYQDIVGTGYVNLSFWYSARPKTGMTNDLGVQFGSFSAVVLNGVANTTSSHQWQQFTLNNFMLDASGTTRLRFSALGKQDTYGGSLDNVVITTAVPEAETYAMMLAGLGLMGATVRRRKSKAA